MKMKKISHSAFKKYLQCAKQYDIHYNQNLRPTGTTSPLHFGSAIDEALNEMLVGTKDPVTTFQENFKFEDMTGVEWHKNDYDPNVFTEEQLSKLSSQTHEYKSWASLRVKGRMLIEKYKEQIYPNILKVYSVQRELKGRRGFIDAIVEYKGEGMVLLDHKTAGQAYKPDAIEADTQLALYAGDTGITKVGFIVLNKKMLPNKKCTKCNTACFSSHKTCPQEKNNTRCHGKFKTRPEAKIQVLIETLKPRQIEIVKEAISEVEVGIDNGYYPKNLTACRSYFGKNCPYLNYCLQNDKTGLQLKKEDK